MSISLEDFTEIIDRIETRIENVEDRVGRTEQSVQDLKTEIASLKAAVERAMSSLLPKVESLLRGDGSATSPGAAFSYPSMPSSSHRTLSSHPQKSLPKSPTPAQEQPNSSTSIHHPSSVLNPQETSVTEAAAAGDAVALRRILANGGSANTRDSNGVPALHLAADKGDVKAVGALIKGGAHLDVEGPGLRTALHVATEKGHVDVVRRLLEAGSSVEVKDGNDNTPLMLAVKSRQWQIVRMLVEKETDSNERVFEGQKSALMVAAEEGDTETVKVVIQKTNPDYVVEALSYAKNASVVWAFEDAFPGIIRKKGGVAMRGAAWNGCLDSMVALLDAGVGIDSKTINNSTALMCASYQGNVECVKELLRREAALDECDIDGWTALHFATMYRKEEVLRVLLGAGADATRRDNNGNTPLDRAETQAIRNILTGTKRT